MQTTADSEDIFPSECEQYNVTETFNECTDYYSDIREYYEVTTDRLMILNVDRLLFTS